MVNTGTVILDVLGIAGLIGGAVAVFASNITRQNTAASSELIANLQQLRITDKEDFTKQITILKKQLDDMENDRKEDLQSIAHLQGQLDTYKSVPLRDWSESMKLLADTNMRIEAQLITIADSNKEISTVLQNSAVIAATDRDALVNPSQTIAEQTVEHQIIKG